MLSAAAILEAISSYNTNTIRIIQPIKTIIIMQAYKKLNLPFLQIRKIQYQLA